MAKKSYTLKNWALLLIALLTVLSLVISFEIDDYYESDIKTKDVKKIEKKLHEQQFSVKHFIDIHPSTSLLSSKFDSCWSTKFQKKGISLFILKNDRVIFWSDNLPIENEQLKFIDTTEQYINIGNGWYVVQAFNKADYKFIAFILIRTEYSYHNNFLKNDFNPIFKFSKNMLIAPIGNDEGAVIKGVNGNPLFVITADIISGQFKLSTLFKWFTVLFLLSFIILIFYNFSTWNKGIYPLFIAISFIIIIRLIIFYNATSFQEGILLFSPTLYATSGFLNSLGDLLLHLFFSYIVLVLFFRNRKLIELSITKLNTHILNIFRLLSIIIISTIAWVINYILNSLILNSNISFEVYKISNLSIYSFIAFIAIIAALAILFLSLQLQTSFFANKNKRFLFISQVIAFLVISSLFCKTYTIEKYVFIVTFILLTALSIYKLSTSTPPFKYFIIASILLSIYSSAMLIEKMHKREQQKRQVWAQSLSNERDPVAEMLLRESEIKILNDFSINKIIKPERLSLDRLIELYFKGYFLNYDIQFQICSPDQQLYINDDNRLDNCILFFNKEREQYGIPISGSSHFWFMNNASGRICYYGEFEFIDSDTKEKNYLFINLFSTSESETIGYPELLLDNATKTKNNIDTQYSYAKYKNGLLITHSGNYDYSNKINDLISKTNDNKFFFKLKNYSHYVYKTNKNVIIISHPLIRPIDIASLFSYNIVILFIGLFCLLFFAGYPVKLNITHLSYRRKITYVLLASITISLTILILNVLIFIVRQSNEKNIEMVQDKLRSVIVSLDQNYWYTHHNTILRKHITQSLINLSNSFYTDINLYHPNGELIATSRDEVFEKKLIGTRMNHDAFEDLTINMTSKFIHWEQIGKMKFYSAYAPLYNADKELIAFVNIPYFFKQSEFREEILQLITNIINIYILLIIMGILIALLISNQLLRPLAEVQKQMKNLNLTHQPQLIKYHNNDEIGKLIQEYNRMIGELAKSAKKLAENQRELAWREMAKQIAHEIKNPLTPMRLNIQHIIRMKKDNIDGWEEKWDILAESMLEQISILSNIASEFASIARINEHDYEPTNIINALNKSINLFRVYSNITFHLEEEGDSEKIIIANNEQLQRVFTNLIKNAVQALENVKDGVIDIIIKQKNSYYIISIEDNGPGIPNNLINNLFQPNFTTKKGGTGLGLAISKSIVESLGGNITYCKSKLGGAYFSIKFPINNIGKELLKNI